jgi:hypothetical protein
VAADVVVVELDMRPARKRVETGSSAANRGGRDARLMRGPAEIRDGNVAKRIGFWYLFDALLLFRRLLSRDIDMAGRLCFRPAFSPAWLHMFSP